MSKIYIATEPDPVYAYLDQNGFYHSNREEALEANFQSDFYRAIVNFAGEIPEYQSLPLRHLGAFVREFVEKHPELTRVLLEDFDLTGGPSRR